MSAVGRRPYLPEGTLRHALLFPAPPQEYPDEALIQALKLVGLDGLSERVDEVADWSRTPGRRRPAGSGR